MPACSSPMQNNQYNKYNSIDGSYSCETCPSIDNIRRDISNFPSPPIFENIDTDSEKENLFRQSLQIGADSTDPIIRNKYGDLLLNLNQCKNYSGQGINPDRADIERESAQSERMVDSGKWEILEKVNNDNITGRLNKCIQGSSSNNSDKSLDDIRICEIVNFYVNTDGYLTGATLDSAIMSQFGSPSTMNNNGVGRVLPPLPEELYPPGGNTVEDYKNFIHQNRGAYITDGIIFRWIMNRRIQEGRGGIPPPSVDNILMEEIYEAWIELTNFKRNTPGASDVLDGLSIQSFFEGQPSSIEFEMCMNNIFDNELHNKYKDHDHNIQGRISEHTDITQLHPREIDYIEDKLKIIATLNPEDAMECMNILNIGEMICDKGVSDRMLKMGYLVMHIIGLDKMHLDGIQPGSHKYQKLKHILDRLTPYIRRAVKKIIEISKYYEKQTCGFESASTHILETIYDDVFEKTKEVDINIQGLDLIPTYLIKDTNMMEFARTIILLIVMIAGIYVLMMILNRPVAVASA
jgi:hypothetical protein